MQTEGQCRVNLGKLRLKLLYAGEVIPGLTHIGKEDFENFKQAVQALEDQKSRLEAREETAFKRETELQAELTILKQEKAALESERHQFFEAAKVQNEEAITLKQRIAQLLLVQEETVSELGSIYTTDLGVTRNTQHCETEMEALRVQVAACRLEGLEAELLKREMDLCEDILVGVMNGDDTRKLSLQISVVKNRMVQSRGKQVMRDAEKMASSIRSTMTLLQGNSRSLEKSKSKIREELMKKLGTPIMSPTKTPPGEAVRYRSTGRLAPPPKPVIVTMESIASPMDSPQITTLHNTDFNISTIETRKASYSPEKSRFKQEDELQKLKMDIRRLKEKLEKYRHVERRLVEERARNKIEEKKLKHISQLLSNREKQVEERESRLALNSDLVSLEAAKSLSTAEARSYLKQRAQTLQDKAEKLVSDQNRLEQDKLNVKVLRDEAMELQRMAEKERRRLAKEGVRLESERKKMQGTLEALNGFCRT